MHKKLGKISFAAIGHYGYQEGMIGIQFVLDLDGTSVNDFWGYWKASVSDEGASWSNDERYDQLGKIMLRISTLLIDSKRESVPDLVGVPIEVTLDGNVMKEWRILKEVL